MLIQKLESFFSKFDDEEGFNEILQPTDQYLVDFFEDYVTRHQKFIDDAQDAIPFCPVIYYGQF